MLLPKKDEEGSSPLPNRRDSYPCTPSKTPQSQEERRRLAAEAADRRAAEANNRGIKDPASVRRMEEKRDQMEQRQQAGDNLDNAQLRVSFCVPTHRLFF